MKITAGFVILAITGDKTKYMSFDDSGSTYYFSNCIHGVKIFKTQSDAEEILKSSDFCKPIEMQDGSIFPPPLLWSAAEIDNDHPKNSVKILICELSSISVAPEIIMVGEIIRK